MVPYVVAVTVMCVLLFVLDACMLGECEGANVTSMLVWGMWRCGGMSARHEYACGTRGSGIVSNAADMIGMCVVCGPNEVGGVCEMCTSLALCGLGGEGVSG